MRDILKYPCDKEVVMGYYDTPDGVIVNFTYTPLVAWKGEPIQFTDLSTNIEINDPCSYEWDWGDGSVNSYTKNATHTYWNVGGYTVVHWVQGSKNLSKNMKVIGVQVGTKEVAPLTCNPAGGSAVGIGDWGASYYENWNPDRSCIHPYLCMNCGGYNAKYLCQPGGSALLISQNHPDCCVYCGVDTSAPGDIPTVLPPAPIFEVVDITIDPPSCSLGDTIRVTAHVKNSGNAAGAATVTIYWNNGTIFSNARTTDIINVNTTVAAPPVIGSAPVEGYLKLCAMVR